MTQVAIDGRLRDFHGRWRTPSHVTKSDLFLLCRNVMAHHDKRHDQYQCRDNADKQRILVTHQHGRVNVTVVPWASVLLIQISPPARSMMPLAM